MIKSIRNCMIFGLMVALGVVFTLPTTTQAATNYGIKPIIPTEETKVEQTSKETTVKTDSEQKAENTGEAANEEDVEVEEVATTVKGVEKHNLVKSVVKKTTDKVKVNHGMGRKVYLEKYTGGEWVRVKTYKAAEEDTTKTIKVTYPVNSKKTGTTKWRVRVPQKTVTETEVNDEGEEVEKQTVYKNAVKSTKTVVGKFAWPIKGKTKISSGYGWRICPFHGREFHPAVDIPAKKGTKVTAAADGTIVFAKRAGSLGKCVVISHSDGTKVTTWYNHLSKISVKKGQTVKQGQVIGRVGSTGSSTGPHLDFRIYVGGKSKNPLKNALRK